MITLAELSDLHPGDALEWAGDEPALCTVVQVGPVSIAVKFDNGTLGILSLEKAAGLLTKVKVKP